MFRYGLSEPWERRANTNPTNTLLITGMGLMGSGGLISIIGGLIFLIVVYLAMRPENNA